MTEDELLERWVEEQPIYEAWGQHVVDQILVFMKDKVAPIGVDVFVRIPPKKRLKQDFSFVEKAFYRKDKDYKDPFADITDKVGARFVVLLGRDLDAVEQAILECTDWCASKDRDPEQETRKSPFEFKYKALHYVLRCRKIITVGGLCVPINTPCEVQVKTLLQHAYSELTHDTIYKPNVDATPEMHRAAAKSMALIEATNDYFESVVDQVEASKKSDRALTLALSTLYQSKINCVTQPSRLEGLLLDAFANFLTTNIAEDITSHLNENDFITRIIENRAKTRLLYRQPSILLTYFLAHKRGAELKVSWPLTDAELRPIFTDLGLSFDNF
jgi:putative GTP pyrophosphokinase